MTSIQDEQFIPTLAIKLAGRLGNVLFEIESGMAIAQHFHLNVCVDSSSWYYLIVRELAPLVNQGEIPNIYLRKITPVHNRLNLVLCT